MYQKNLKGKSYSCNHSIMATAQSGLHTLRNRLRLSADCWYQQFNNSNIYNLRCPLLVFHILPNNAPCFHRELIIVQYTRGVITTSSVRSAGYMALKNWAQVAIQDIIKISFRFRFSLSSTDKLLNSRPRMFSLYEIVRCKVLGCLSRMEFHVFICPGELHWYETLPQYPIN